MEFFISHDAELYNFLPYMCIGDLFSKPSSQQGTVASWLQVFSQLDAGARRALLPLVCQQWRELTSQPTSLWTHLDIDFASEAFSDSENPGQVRYAENCMSMHYYCVPTRGQWAQTERGLDGSSQLSTDRGSFAPLKLIAHSRQYDTEGTWSQIREQSDHSRADMFRMQHLECMP